MRVELIGAITEKIVVRNANFIGHFFKMSMRFRFLNRHVKKSEIACKRMKRHTGKDFASLYGALKGPLKRFKSDVKVARDFSE